MTIEMELPDDASRAELLRLYARNIKTGGEVDYRSLGAEMEALSGRDIANIVDKAVIEAAVADRSLITEADLSREIARFREAIEKKR